MRKFAWIHAIVAVIVVFSSVLLPYQSVRAESVQIIPGITNEASNLPDSSFGYFEFRNETRTFSYNGGNVCISSSSSSCVPVQVDDGIKVWVNGQEITPQGGLLSRTQPVGPINVPTNLLAPLGNAVRVVLYDVQGLQRGSSPIYLVIGGSSQACSNPVGINHSLSGQLARTEFLYGEYTFEAEVSATGYHCSSFVSFNTGDGGFSFQINSDSRSVSLSNRGRVQVSGWQTSGSSNQLVQGVDTNSQSIFWGLENSTSINDLNGSGLSLQLGSSYLNSFRFKAPNFETLGMDEKIYLAGAAAVIVLLTPADEAAVGLLILKQLSQGGQLQAQSIEQAASVATPLENQASTVSGELQQAIATKYGPLSQWITVNDLVSRDKVSAYTVFAYNGGGFTPNGEVLVTFGKPDGEEFLYDIVTADSVGNITGSLEMPTPENTVLGNHLLTALDYQSLTRSLDDFFAGRVSQLSLNVRAKLIEVVQDVTPPTTTAFATGPKDMNNIFRDKVTISFVAEDDLSRIRHVQYSRNNGTSWTDLPPNGTFTIDGNGITNFLYRSVDKVGNVEQVRDSGPIMINKYVVFQGGTSTTIIEKNSSSSINGTMHTNGSASIKSNTGVTLNGTLNLVGTVTSSYNTNTVIPTAKVAAQPILSYPITNYEALADVVYPTSVTINSTGKSLKGIHYVKGSLTLKSATLTGDVTFIVRDNFYDYSTGTSIVNSDPNNGIVVYAGGNITIHNTGLSAIGMYYAPNGTITLDGVTGMTLNGSLVGKTIAIRRITYSSINYNAGFAPSTHELPLTPLVGLAAVATDYDQFIEPPIGNPMYLPFVKH